MGRGRGKGRGRGRGRENVGERKKSEAKKRETKNEMPKWWEGEKNKWEVCKFLSGARDLSQRFGETYPNAFRSTRIGGPYYSTFKSARTDLFS